MTWLSLEISDSPKPGLFISVPKKIVPLATKRNRIKRLIREAVRRDLFFSAKKKYYFRVIRRAEDLNLEKTRKAIDALK